MCDEGKKQTCDTDVQQLLLLYLLYCIHCTFHVSNKHALHYCIANIADCSKYYKGSKTRQLSNYLFDFGMWHRKVYNYWRLPKRAYRRTKDLH